MTDVWIIDDEESIRTICTSALEDIFNIESFANASEALLALNSKKPDLIITDIKMPGMSGLDFLEKVSDKFPEIPTIIITAHANIDNALKSYQADNKLSVPKVNQPIRIALTGSTKSPSLGLTLELFGKEESLSRLDRFLSHLKP